MATVRVVREARLIHTVSIRILQNLKDQKLCLFTSLAQDNDLPIFFEPNTSILCVRRRCFITPQNSNPVGQAKETNQVKCVKCYGGKLWRQTMPNSGYCCYGELALRKAMKGRDGQLPEITVKWVKCEGHLCNQCDIMFFNADTFSMIGKPCPFRSTTSNGFNGYQHTSIRINTIVCSEPGRHTSGWQRSRAGTKRQNRECIQHDAHENTSNWNKNRSVSVQAESCQRVRASISKLGVQHRNSDTAAPSLDHENSSRSGASPRAKHLIAFPGPIISRSAAFCYEQISKLPEFRDAKVHKMCIKCNTHLYQFAEPPHHGEIQRALSIPRAWRNNMNVRYVKRYISSGINRAEVAEISEERLVDELMIDAEEMHLKKWK